MAADVRLTVRGGKTLRATSNSLSIIARSLERGRGENIIKGDEDGDKMERIG